MGTPELDPFQHETLAFLDHARGRAVLADPMGARKTGTTLAWLNHACPAESPFSVLKTLIVAPSAVHQHWLREADRFYPYAGQYIGNGKEKRHEAIARAAATAEEGLPALYVTTYESMKADQRLLKAAKFDAVVFDEGHRLKGRRNQVALCANDVTKQAKHLIIATGTPVLNHAAELWQYLHMIAPGAYPAFWRWAETHYKIEIRNFKGNRFPTRIIHDFLPGHEEIVRNQIEPWFIQRDIKELFPGAPWTVDPEHIEVPVELSPAESKLYDSLVDHKWGLAGGREVTTQNPLDLNTRLNQITSDWGSLDETLGDGAKTGATVELVADLLERDEPVLVFAKYKATVTRIVDALARKHVKVAAYHGDIDLKIRNYAVDDFGAGKLDVLVGTLDSMSEGVDGCQGRCSTVVMVDRHWTPAKNDQAIGRLRRSGQVRKVQVYHIFAKGTLDATITAACLTKTNVIQTLKGMPLVDAIYGRV